jgi:hypothetical protein
VTLKKDALRMDSGEGEGLGYRGPVERRRKEKRAGGNKHLNVEQSHTTTPIPYSCLHEEAGF